MHLVYLEVLVAVLVLVRVVLHNQVVQELQIKDLMEELEEVLIVVAEGAVLLLLDQTHLETEETVVVVEILLLLVVQYVEPEAEAELKMLEVTYLVQLHAVEVPVVQMQPDKMQQLILAVVAVAQQTLIMVEMVVKEL